MVFGAPFLASKRADLLDNEAKIGAQVFCRRLPVTVADSLPLRNQEFEDGTYICIPKRVETVLSTAWGWTIENGVEDF